MIKMITMVLLSVVATFGGQTDTQFEIDKVTKIIENNNGMFLIKFDINHLQSMIEKKLNRTVKDIKIDIAPGKTIRAIKESIVVNYDDNSTYSWFGKTSDGKGQVVLSVRKGRMIGTVSIGSEHYTITPDGNHFKVIKNDPEMMIPVGEDEVSSPFKLEKTPELIPTDTQAEDTAEPVKYESPTSEASVNGNITIDLLVLYTKAMKQKYGNDTELKIQHLFDLAKKAYSDSKTGVKLHLVHLQSLSDSSTLNDIVPDGNHLNTLSSDGYVAYLRRKYHADMVSVISHYTGGGTCGIGFLPKHEGDTMTRAFSIVMVRSASEGGGYCSDMTFAHELGHNFSCQHDRDHTSGSSIYEYSYGYDIADKFATIMSYDRPKISYFSNPSLIDDNSGNHIGVADEEDNARAIRNTRTKIADNSDEIDESIENGDHSIADGKLNSNKDQDAYVITLGGQTSFQVAHPKYSNTWGYYVNIYNTKTHNFVASCKNDCEMDLDNGQYRVVVSYRSNGGSYYGGNGDRYSVEVNTEYSKPPYPVSIINYLLQ